MIQHMMPLTASRVVVENAPDRLVIREDRWGGRTVADLGEYTAEKHALGELFAAAPDMLDALKVVCYALAAVRDGEDDPKVWTLEELKYSIVDRIIEAVEPGFDDGTTTLGEARDNIRIFAAALARAEGR